MAHHSKASQRCCNWCGAPATGQSPCCDRCAAAGRVSCHRPSLIASSRPASTSETPVPASGCTPPSNDSATSSPPAESIRTTPRTSRSASARTVGPSPPPSPESSPTSRGFSFTYRSSCDVPLRRRRHCPHRDADTPLRHHHRPDR